MAEINKEVPEKSYKCPKCGNIDVYNECYAVNYEKYKPHWDELSPGEVILCRHCGAEICKNMSNNYLKYNYTNPDKINNLKEEDEVNG